MKFAIISLFLFLFSCKFSEQKNVHLDVITEFLHLQENFKFSIDLIEDEASFDSASLSLGQSIVSLAALAENMKLLKMPSLEEKEACREIVFKALATQPSADSALDLLTIESREKEVTVLLSDYASALRKVEEECARLYGTPLQDKKTPMKPAF